MKSTKSIKDLKHPDIISIDGNKYQVVRNTSLLYHTDRSELEMMVELIKVGDKKITPDYRLTYIYERSAKVKFFAFDPVTKEFKEQKVKKIEF